MFQHKNPCLRCHGIYNFGIKHFLGHQYYILMQSYIAVEKKIFKK